ncbi:zymogen granule membrane protein 16-like [Phycodurus eques]|uniref:zymogen granule membrane protein 16-like n=1 Tax=Phycodurus eques TaxID=693459 RepID=UPI002ACE39DA|nr:zymogen granule membrane protein 16-like [Phycodurus eques]XP_061520521.1 zymogen granule membrane protein 16-like [Phycodurus eques]
MHSIAIITLLMLCAFPTVQPEMYSFSQPVGPGGGDSFTLSGDGAITAVRLWERYNSIVTGIQFRYGPIWSPVVGMENGMVKEIQLFKDETIIQISGMYTNVMQSIVLVTNKGRALHAGQPRGTSFNMYADNKETQLRLLSGQYRNGFTFFGSHWGVPHYYL